MGFSNTKGFVKEENSKTKEILQGSNDCQQAREDLGCAERKIVTRCCCCVSCVGFDDDNNEGGRSGTNEKEQICDRHVSSSRKEG